MLEHGAGAASEEFNGVSMLGLWYDPDRLIVEGVYHDEVTAYRARKRWIEALEHNFLLEESHDFSLKVRRSRGGKHFRVRCDFLTACGRYAFWRLTHHQAPEVQLILETAHLPHAAQAAQRKLYVDDDEMFLSIDQMEHRPCMITQGTDSEPYLRKAMRQIHNVAHRIVLLSKALRGSQRNPSR
jgi:hypothetical protein